MSKLENQAAALTKQVANYKTLLDISATNIEALETMKRRVEHLTRSLRKKYSIPSTSHTIACEIASCIEAILNIDTKAPEEYYTTGLIVDCDDDGYRAYITMNDHARLKLVCVTDFDGNKKWFEERSTLQIITKKLSNALSEIDDIKRNANASYHRAELLSAQVDLHSELSEHRATTIDELKIKLNAVTELYKKWRSDNRRVGTTEHAIRKSCADELEAILTQ